MDVIKKYVVKLTNFASLSIFSPVLHRTSEAVTEAELWSCYFIRRVFWVFKLAAKPCVISLKQISQLANM